MGGYIFYISPEYRNSGDGILATIFSRNARFLMMLFSESELEG